MSHEHPVGLARGRVSLLVDHPGRRLVAHAPAGAVQPPAEVDVLDVHEVSLVEAADRLEAGAPHKQAGARHPVGVAGPVLFVAEQPVPARPRVAAPEQADKAVPESVAEVRERPARRVDRAVRLQEHRARHGCVQVRVESLDEALDGLRLGDEVGIADEQELALAVAGTEVRPGAVAPVARRTYEAAWNPCALRQGGRAIGRAIVHHDDVGDPVALQARQTACQHLACVVVDDDRADSSGDV